MSPRAAMISRIWARHGRSAEETMKKTTLPCLLAIGLLLLAAAPSYAWQREHGRVFIGVGPGYWWGPPPYAYGPYPYGMYPPPYYPYPATPVVVEQPPVYVQPQPAPAPPSAPPSASWYYCSSSQAYYPDVNTCQEGWVRVPARP
jgi:hypothetical protein